MTTPPSDVNRAYLILLRRAIVHMRFRLRSGDAISSDEFHDWLDALHNIPEMLVNYGSGGGWFVEENIDWSLAWYDDRWRGKPTSAERMSLMDALTRAKNGEFDEQ
jgi:hypothetical protein